METLKVLNNRYQFLSVIKRGGFGIIYKGYDSVLGKDIAIKEIKPNLLQEAQYIDQFQIEARHAAKMNHLNIVHIFDLVQTEDKKFYIVMEYIDGLDLSKLLKESQLRGELIPQHLAVYIVAEVCKALDYAHNCSSTDNNEPLNLVHQDISPSNIMISNSGLVKLIDFGIAGLYRLSITEKDKISLQGKIHYMSPEHLSLDTHPDKRSDLFSLGLVLYETLEGKRFFQNDDRNEIIETLRNGKFKFKDLQHTHNPLQKVLHKALEKSPEKRYQNANQFYIELVTYLVLNTDSSQIDTELGEFVSKFTTNKNEEKPIKGKFEIHDSDNFFETVFDDFKIVNTRGGETEIQNIPSEESKNIEPYQKDLHERYTFPPVQKEYTPRKDDGNLQDDLEGEDEIKTIIDVVRLSTRGHKKQFLKGLIGLIGLIVIFFVMDITFQWTQFGIKIYDYLFPPAIKISSVPPRAQVYLDNKLLPGETPISIDKIQPGVHELKLTALGYAPIVKSIHVPSKGKIYIRGEQSRQGNRPYVFRFKTTIEFESVPQGAEVYINNIKYGQITPCTVTWEVGESCQIEMRKIGFSNLTHFTLDTEEMVEDVEDRRIWKLDINQEPYIRYKIKGVFGKFITIKSNPSNADIYLGKNPNSIGITGKRDKIFFSATSHTIILRKKGFNPRTIKLKVNESTPLQISANLSRPVKFFAQDANQASGQEIGAVITKIVRNDKIVIRGKHTPCRINLLPYTYYAIFSKKGYQDIKVQISPTDNFVIAKMVPLEARITLVILDELSGDPLSNVEVSFKSLDNPKTSEKIFDVTDIEGTCSGRLLPGLYVFRTSKNGYSYQEKSIMVQAFDMNLIEFNLSKL
ncbi:MAG: serine/threonine-protein kinase [bacterium]